MSDDIVIEVPQDGKEHGLIGKISFALRVFCEAKGLGLGIIDRVTVTHYQQREKPPLEKRDRAIVEEVARSGIKTEACPYCTRIPGWVVGAVKVDDKGRCVRCGHTVAEFYTPSAERNASDTGSERGPYKRYDAAEDCPKCDSNTFSLLWGINSESGIEWLQVQCAACGFVGKRAPLDAKAVVVDITEAYYEVSGIVGRPGIYRRYDAETGALIGTRKVKSDEA